MTTTFGALPEGARFQVTPHGRRYRKIDGLAVEQPLWWTRDPDGFTLADDRPVYPI